MSVRASWLLLLTSACAPVPVANDGAGAAPPALAQLVEVAIEFAPPLPTAGTARIEHESGWVWSGAAPPSGLTVRMPPGPANLLLEVGGEVRESAFRVPFAVERWSWRVTR